MYVTEKTLRMEIREMQSSMHDVANDLGGDIRYLHQEITQLRDRIDLLLSEVEELKERQRNAEL